MPRNNWDGAAYILAVLKSIKSEGLKKPLVVRKNKNKFEILLGGARYWALRKIKAKNIPCIIISEKQVLNTERLLNKLKELKRKAIGKPILLSYDAPYKFYNRRNEVLIELSN